MHDNTIESAAQATDRKITVTEQARRAWDSLAAECPFPPGNCFSPYPSETDVERASRAWSQPPAELPGIDLNTRGQLELLEAFTELDDEELTFPHEPDPDWRFYLAEPSLPPADATVLSMMIRHLRPTRIVEVGAGFSSALMLDINERFLENGIGCTFIDPDLDRLLGLLRPGDAERVSLMPALVQDVPLATFEQLKPNDILFIDSSHVSKTGSDVNHLMFEVLPRLATGVHVHVHDIGYPFEYPAEWIVSRRWVFSEAYLVRAFLQHNSDFRICFFTPFLMKFHRDAISQTIPYGPASSIWFSRVAGP